MPFEVFVLTVIVAVLVPIISVLSKILTIANLPGNIITYCRLVVHYHRRSHTTQEHKNG